MQKEDKETNTAYLFASEKERYDAQLRSLRAQAESKEKELSEIDEVGKRSEAVTNSLKAEVENLEKLSTELQATVEKIEETIASKKLEDEVVVQINTQVEKVEKLRKDKIQVCFSLVFVIATHI